MKFPLLENWKNLVEKANKLDRKTLNAIKTVIFVLIVADLFGVYYFLRWKALAIALLVVFIVALAFVLFLLKKQPLEPQPAVSDKPNSSPPPSPTQLKNKEEKMPEKKETAEMEESNQDEQEEQGFGLDFDTGLPSSEEFNERMKKAVGDWGF